MRRLALLAPTTAMLVVAVPAAVGHGDRATQVLESQGVYVAAGGGSVDVQGLRATVAAATRIALVGVMARRRRAR